MQRPGSCELDINSPIDKAIFSFLDSSLFQETKKKLGLSLITFEDASIELDPFCKTHLFETFPFLSSEIIKHYQDELISQDSTIKRFFSIFLCFK